MQCLRRCPTGEILTDRIARATTPWDRAIGLLTRRAVDPSEGMWFDRCALVHTLGMRACIDIVFLDRRHTVVRVVSRAARNRVFYGGSRARVTLELGPGAAAEHRLVAGDRLSLE